MREASVASVSRMMKKRTGTTASSTRLFPHRDPPLNCSLIAFKVGTTLYITATSSLPPNLAWRKLLKDLIAYFREVAASYEHRAKSLLKVSNVINNTNAPSMFMTEGGLNDANRLLRDFHKQAIAEANKARDVEVEVVNQLSGLRSDLSQKIKEIKALSGDFKNSVEKEKETTRKCVAALDEALALVDSDPAAIAGKGDPYVVRLGVDRQVERQIDEENYLHRVSFIAVLPVHVMLIFQRPISTSKILGGSWNPSSLARSRERIMPLRASSNVRQMRSTRPLTSSGMDPSACLGTSSGTNSCSTIHILLTPTFL